MSIPTSIPDYPVTASGKRNWSHSAVFGNTPEPSRETIPASGQFGFADLIDIINPLQHIPIIGQIYRALTGDTLGTPARILGGLAFGGPMGFISGVGSSILAETGASERALTSVFGSGVSSNILMSKAYTGRSDAHVKSALDLNV